MQPSFHIYILLHWLTVPSQQPTRNRVAPDQQGASTHTRAERQWPFFPRHHYAHAVI